MRINIKVSYAISAMILLSGCSINIEKPENLLSAKPHIEHSIIYNVPKSPRLCDEMKVEKQFVNIGDCKLYCEIEGEGIPLVLIHGGPGGTHHCFHPWLSGAKNKFKIIYYDQRGCGLSDFNAGEGYSFEQTVEDLESLRKTLRIDKWIVLGHSYGGGVAQYYTIKYPQNVIGQVLVSTVPMINKPEINARKENHFMNEQEIQKIEEIAKLTVDGKLSYAQYFYNTDINGGWKRENFLKPQKERPAQLATYDIVFDKTFNSDFELYDFEHAFETCPIPTLICEGKYDSLWTARKVPALLNNFPNSKFKSFEYSSHNIYSDEPELFIKEIEDWAETLKDINGIDITDWKIYTDKLLGQKIQLIQNDKAFIKLLKDDGLIAAKKYYKDFKKNSPEQPLFFENSIIRIGYKYIGGDKFSQAIELFELNAKEYPKSWNAYDCLGEAYMMAGEKKLAIENYEKSLRINPNNMNAIDQIEKLKY